MRVLVWDHADCVQKYKKINTKYFSFKPYLWKKLVIPSWLGEIQDVYLQEVKQ